MKLKNIFIVFSCDWEFFSPDSIIGKITKISIGNGALFRLLIHRKKNLWGAPIKPIVVYINHDPGMTLTYFTRLT